VDIYICQEFVFGFVLFVKGFTLVLVVEFKLKIVNLKLNIQQIHKVSQKPEKYLLKNLITFYRSPVKSVLCLPSLISCKVAGLRD